jgi:ubiquinone/menaquinone biosynthesis C-methylase UbiE
MANVRDVSTQEGYDLWSKTYDQPGNPLVALEEPVMAELLGAVSGISILDVGCGTGRHSLKLARQGARVTGFDFSAGMLDRARMKAEALAAGERSLDPERAVFRMPRFLVHDVAKPFPFQDGSFDRVICALVFDHVSELRPVFSEMKRVCRAGGFVVVTSMHPAVQWMGRQANFTDSTTGEEIRPASASNQVTDYVKAALGAGFEISDLRELVATSELVRATPKAEKFVGWPLLLTMKLS